MREVPRELYPFAGRTLDLDGLRYHYLDEGEGDPVVALHGNPTWSFYFRELVLALRGDYRLVVPTTSAAVCRTSRMTAATRTPWSAESAISGV